MYYDMTHDKKITNSFQNLLKRVQKRVKMLSRGRIEPMPTDNEHVTGVKNSKSPIVLTPPPQLTLRWISEL